MNFLEPENLFSEYHSDRPLKPGIVSQENLKILVWMHFVVHSDKCTVLVSPLLGENFVVLKDVKLDVLDEIAT